MEILNQRYIDTKPNRELIHYCLEIEPYKYQFIANPDTPGIDGAPPTRPSRVMETYATVLEEIKKKIDAEAEVVQIILTGIDNDIYSTVDACPNAMETMTKNEVNDIRVERLARTANPLALVAATQQPVYHPQTKPTHYTQSSSTKSQTAIKNKGKEIANTLLPDSEPEAKIYKPTTNNLRTSSNTRNKNINDTLKSDRRTRYERQTGQYENEREVNVAGTRDNVGTQVVQQTGIQCFNCKEFGHVVRECKKANRVRDSAYHKEKMLLCKQEEAGIQLSAKQIDWQDDKDDEPENQELDAHYMYMENIQEVISDDVDNSGPIFDTESLKKVHNTDDNYNVFAHEKQHHEQPESINDTYVMEKDDRNISPDSSYMYNDEREADQDTTK
ncbi:integrase, catalytic region, zinc finger, CCHC-type containing protein, partial [Tanacetum coccineum]